MTTLENPVTGERFEVVAGTVRFRLGLPRTCATSPRSRTATPRRRAPR